MPSGRLVTIPRTSRGSTAPESETLNSAAAYEPARDALRALVVLAAFVAMLAVASPAAAAQSCGRAVIDDWYDNGRVDGTYALHCYDDAIEILPRDVRDYSSAKDDIQRALQNRKRGEPAPPARRPTRRRATTPSTTADDSGEHGHDRDDGARRPRTTRTIRRPRHGVRAAPTDTDSASSVPIPLLILAGLALLLVIGGSAGYVIRRLQARRLPAARGLEPAAARSCG